MYIYFFILFIYFFPNSSNCSISSFSTFSIWSSFFANSSSFIPYKNSTKFNGYNFIIFIFDSISFSFRLDDIIIISTCLLIFSSSSSCFFGFMFSALSKIITVSSFSLEIFSFNCSMFIIVSSFSSFFLYVIMFWSKSI